MSDPDTRMKLRETALPDSRFQQNILMFEEYQLLYSIAQSLQELNATLKLMIGEK